MLWLPYENQEMKVDFGALLGFPILPTAQPMCRVKNHLHHARPERTSLCTCVHQVHIASSFFFDPAPNGAWNAYLRALTPP
jgi:hypothetical protein